MTDRHQELRRQYELVRQHLSWLEQEIARESTSQPVRPAAPPKPPQTPAAVARPPLTPAAPASLSPEALLSQYAETERHDPASMKRGCLLVFAAALALLVTGVLTAYFVHYAHR